ncbi:hypothetical protein [Mesonia maritima]|uniref:Uncharacterized protein n=1 Tax=Mesonia maritima TaxID=1793873 RepID=A0ABU1K5Z4_9FLAO|nr:hypothetical protein [Mesonia maritima]MDR6301031.1 hypothetical protein [Mesonia maritima]
MKLKNFIFVIAIAGFLATSCSPQSIDEHTTKENIQGDGAFQPGSTNIDKGDIIIPSNG